jgi:hypothetical protein
VRLQSLAHPWRTHTWRAAGTLALIAGYADLARGGVTFAPTMLVIAYLILVPLALASW